jgi:hypothetical protein
MSLIEFIRPSSLSAIALCAARPLAEAEACRVVPALRNLSNAAAEQGNLGHIVLADVIRDAFTGDWSQAPVVIAGIESRMTHLAAWTKDAVRGCLTYAMEVIKELAGHYPIIRIEVERHLGGDKIDIERGGTADLLVICHDDFGVVQKVVVIDHKCGFLSQGEASDNLQLAAYAVMAFDFYSPNYSVVVHLSAGRRNEYSSCQFTPSDIEKVRSQIIAIAKRAKESRPSIRPSIKACQYCKALSLCPAARSKIMDAQEQFQLFGAEPKDRMQLSLDAQLAKRFAQSAAELMKLWQDQEHHKN